MRGTKFWYLNRVFQELKLRHTGKWLHFCHWLYYFIHNCYSILDYIFFSNEAWFHLSGYIYTHNYGVWWSSMNLHIYQEASFYSLNVGVWCAMSCQWIVGQSSLTSTITTETCRWIITDFSALLEHCKINTWFQQVNVHPHTAWETMLFL